MEGHESAGLPGLRGVDHVGITVPDIEQAAAFFVAVLGCELLYEREPPEDDSPAIFSASLPVAASGPLASCAAPTARTSSSSSCFQRIRLSCQVEAVIATKPC